MTDSFVFYRSYFEAISDLTDTNQLLLYQAIANYSLNDIEPNFKGTIGTLFKLIKPQIDSNKKRRKDGTNGGRPPKTEKETSGLGENKPVVIEIENHRLEENKPNVNGNGDVNENGNDNEKVNVVVSDRMKSFNLKYKRVQKLKEPITDEQLETLLKDYGRDIMTKIFDNMENFKKLHTNYMSAYLTANNWAKKEKETPTADSPQVAPLPKNYIQ